MNFINIIRQKGEPGPVNYEIFMFPGTYPSYRGVKKQRRKLQVHQK